MLTPAERKLALRRVPAFAELDDVSLRGLEICLRWREYQAGETIYQQGNEGDSLAIVAVGVLAATVKLQRGGEYELGCILPGDIVG
jgi:CRP-like cAMP-binding protein